MLIVGRLQRWGWTAEDCTARSTVEVVAELAGSILGRLTTCRALGNHP